MLMQRCVPAQFRDGCIGAIGAKIIARSGATPPGSRKARPDDGLPGISGFADAQLRI
jgi:hypothetical protein